MTFSDLGGREEELFSLVLYKEISILRQSSWGDFQDYSEMHSDDVEIQMQPMSGWGYGLAKDAEQEFLDWIKILNVFNEA